MADRISVTNRTYLVDDFNNGATFDITVPHMGNGDTPVCAIVTTVGTDTIATNSTATKMAWSYGVMESFTPGQGGIGMAALGSGGTAYGSHSTQETNVIEIPTYFASTHIQLRGSFIADGIRLTSQTTSSTAYGPTYLRVTVVLIWDAADAECNFLPMSASATETITTGFQSDVVFCMGSHRLTSNGAQANIACSWGCALPEGSSGHGAVSRDIEFGNEYGVNPEDAWAVARSGRCFGAMDTDGASNAWYVNISNYTSTSFDLGKLGTGYSGRRIGYLAIKFTNKPSMTLATLSCPTTETTYDYNVTAPNHRPTIKIGAAITSNSYGGIVTSGAQCWAMFWYSMDLQRGAVTYASASIDEGAGTADQETKMCWTLNSGIYATGVGGDYISNGSLTIGSDGSTSISGVSSSAGYYGWELSISSGGPVAAGQSLVGNIYLGSTEVNDIYLGSTKIR